MSRSRILICTIALLLGCFSGMAMELDDATLKIYLKPWCDWKNKQIEKHVEKMKERNNSNWKDADDLKPKGISTFIEELKGSFSSDGCGAYNFITEFTSASNESFDGGNVKDPDAIQARVLLGLIYLANSVYKGDQGKKAGLGYRIKDAIEMFNNISVVKGKLELETEQKYLDNLYNEEVAVDSNSESDEDEK